MRATRDAGVLRSWIGRSVEAVDILGPRPARLMQATLDQSPSLGMGDELPPLWHWLYFLDGAPLSELGRDGHARLGDFLPAVDLPRRMWAGGRFAFHAPIRIGEEIRKVSTIKEVALKEGRSGALCFVTVLHELFGGDGGLRLGEEHDIVYREDPAPGASEPAPVAPPDGAAMTETVTPTPVMLFRYSALTFNGHRIHYDRDYAREVEGYPGLVFHGPLTATLLADLAVRQMRGRRLVRFDYRGVRPLLDTAPFAIKARAGDAVGTVEVWAETPDKHLAMTARAAFAVT